MDTAKNKNYSLDVDFKSIRGAKKTRMDVRAFMGMHLASVVLDGSKYQALLMKKKIFREGEVSGNSLDPEVLGVGIDLRMIPATLYDDGINDPGWACNFDAANLATSCENASDSVRIFWSRRDGVKKEIEVEAPTYKMKISVDKFTPEEQFPEKTFMLPLPKGFKKIH